MALKFGIVGCGSIARARHAPELAANKDAQLSAFCDKKIERAEELASKYGGKAYSNIDDMLAQADLDAVVVCVPNCYHAPYTIAALNAAKHVLCEKPMATSHEEAENMIEAARKSGKNLMIGHNQRLERTHVRAKEILQSGRLGKVLTFRTAFGHGGPEGWSIEKSNDTWFFHKDEAILGAMGDLGVHKADLIRWLIGEEIEEACAFVGTFQKCYPDGRKIDVDDNACCVLRSETGIIGTLVASWSYRGAGDNKTILCCEKGMMLLGESDFQVKINYNDGSKEYHDVGKMATNEKQTESGVSSLFVKEILANSPPRISAQEGARALAIVLACFESSASGRAVKVREY